MADFGIIQLQPEGQVVRYEPPDALVSRFSLLRDTLNDTLVASMEILPNRHARAPIDTLRTSREKPGAKRSILKAVKSDETSVEIPKNTIVRCPIPENATMKISFFQYADAQTYRNLEEQGLPMTDVLKRAVDLSRITPGQPVQPGSDQRLFGLGSDHPGVTFISQRNARFSNLYVGISNPQDHTVCLHGALAEEVNISVRTGLQTRTIILPIGYDMVVPLTNGTIRYDDAGNPQKGPVPGLDIVRPAARPLVFPAVGQDPVRPLVFNEPPAPPAVQPLVFPAVGQDPVRPLVFKENLLQPVLPETPVAPPAAAEPLSPGPPSVAVSPEPSAAPLVAPPAVSPAPSVAPPAAAEPLSPGPPSVAPLVAPPAVSPAPSVAPPAAAEPLSPGPPSVAVSPEPSVAPLAPESSAAPVSFQFPATLPADTPVFTVKGDGLCFYRTVLKGLESNPTNDSILEPPEPAIQFAVEIASWLHDHSSECAPTFDRTFGEGGTSTINMQGKHVHMTFAEYLQNLVQPELGVYPEIENCTGRAAAELKNIQIGFYHRFGSRTEYLFYPPSYGTSGKPIYIAASGDHFDLLVPGEPLTATEIPGTTGTTGTTGATDVIVIAQPSPLRTPPNPVLNPYIRILPIKPAQIVVARSNALRTAPNPELEGFIKLV